LTSAESNRPMRNITILLALTGLFLPSCGPSVKYLGRSYASTSHVDVYSNTKEVKEKYDIMGNAEGTALLLTDYDKIKKSIVNEAKTKGANGVIFTGIGERVVYDSKDSSNSHVVSIIGAEFIRYR
jgi:hypothetical protein